MEDLIAKALLHMAHISRGLVQLLSIFQHCCHLCDRSKSMDSHDGSNVFTILHFPRFSYLSTVVIPRQCCYPMHIAQSRIKALVHSVCLSVHLCDQERLNFNLILYFEHCRTQIGP